MIDGDDRSGGWSDAAQVLALAVAVLLALAAFSVMQPGWHRPRVLVAAAGLGIGSAILVARARMPVPAKAGLIAAICVALLAMGTANDPFGLRAVDRKVAEATAPAESSGTTAGDTTNAAAVSTRIRLNGPGDAAAGRFASDLAAAVADRTDDDTGADHVDGLIELDRDHAGETYRLTWSVGRADETRWCGQVVAVGQPRQEVLKSFSTTIAAALRHRPATSLACA